VRSCSAGGCCDRQNYTLAQRDRSAQLNAEGKAIELAKSADRSARYQLMRKIKQASKEKDVQHAKAKEEKITVAVRSSAICCGLSSNVVSRKQDEEKPRATSLSNMYESHQNLQLDVALTLRRKTLFSCWSTCPQTARPGIPQDSSERSGLPGTAHCIR
jgi:cell division protein FtsI/penicillin-binding protein 2